MRRLFVDTSAYFALTDMRDENHEAAVHFIHQLIRERAELLTTNYIVAETHILLLNRIGYATALRVLEELSKSQTRSYRVREAEERKALEIIRRYTDKEFSLVDAISFATMDRFHLTEAFAFDHHFAQYGLSLLPVTMTRFGRAGERSGVCYICRQNGCDAIVSVVSTSLDGPIHLVAQREAAPL